MSDDDIEQARAGLRIAGETLRRALARSRLAPPDAGYVRRLRQFGDACDANAVAAASAAKAGCTWAPSLTMSMPHELSPDSGRPGPPALWQAFDEAVEDVNEAWEGISFGPIERAFARLSKVALELADAVDLQRSDSERTEWPAEAAET